MKTLKTIAITGALIAGLGTALPTNGYRTADWVFDPLPVIGPIIITPPVNPCYPPCIPLPTQPTPVPPTDA